jgi:hypothetical protein
MLRGQVAETVRAHSTGSAHACDRGAMRLGDDPHDLVVQLDPSEDRRVGPEPQHEQLVVLGHRREQLPTPQEREPSHRGGQRDAAEHPVGFVAPRAPNGDGGSAASSSTFQTQMRVAGFALTMRRPSGETANPPRRSPPEVDAFASTWPSHRPVVRSRNPMAVVSSSTTNPPGT